METAENNDISKDKTMDIKFSVAHFPDKSKSLGMEISAT